MQKLSLDALARELLSQVTDGGTSTAAAKGSRAAHTVVGGHEKALRQTVIALAKDAALAEHASPGEASLYVLRGRVTLTAGAESWEGRDGDLLLIPDAPHSLTAQANSAVLLTVVKRPLRRRSRGTRLTTRCPQRDSNPCRRLERAVS
jgi:quercetin dioxygenase-like cupin family protein